MTTPRDKETFPLDKEDRDRLIRVETVLVEKIAPLVEDHANRLGKVETRLTRQLMSQTGLWATVMVGVGFLGKSLGIK
jgi:hypothetical protein